MTQLLMRLVREVILPELRYVTLYSGKSVSSYVIGKRAHQREEEINVHGNTRAVATKKKEGKAGRGIM